MTDPNAPRISRLAEPWVDLPPGLDDEGILRSLEGAGCRFALVRPEGASASGMTGHPPVGRLLVREGEGTLYSDAPLVVVDAYPDQLDAGTLLALATELAHTDAPGAVVLLDDAPQGVIGRAELISAVPLDLLAGGRDRQGTPEVPPLRYVCRQCAPPSVRLLRAAPPEPPMCARDWFHGRMESAPL